MGIQHSYYVCFQLYGYDFMLLHVSIDTTFNLKAECRCLIILFEFIQKFRIPQMYRSKWVE